MTKGPIPTSHEARGGEPSHDPESEPYFRRVSAPKRLLIACAITLSIVLIALVAHIGPFRDDAASAGPTAQDVWCYTLSTATGYYYPAAGAVIGAVCLFLPKSSPANIQCFKTVLRVGPTIVGQGAGLYRRGGRCLKGEWGIYSGSIKWVRFR